ncbi:DUF397 domain-containing protein [Micromonospora robiginosa]|uniref:DUF397 domain-containing protein n=1 Tax=Micromonospora robiginosa TaxID=2749844 RepID=A0AAF0P4Z8_9ACTN|nr:DUF397 domain-containing protein [Micromonospora ferruginea]WMF04577.1 DUF397 domain-containing protein [Micromonospora ferruginea]
MARLRRRHPGLVRAVREPGAISQPDTTVRRGACPSLLQTRAYAFSVYQHRSEVTEEERERLVEVRLQRQALLTRRLPPAPKMDVVVSEAALLRVVGDRETMAEQLRHLLTVGERPNVRIRVLPLSAGLHRGVEAGTFVMLEFPPGNRATPEGPVLTFTPAAWTTFTVQTRRTRATVAQ